MNGRRWQVEHGVSYRAAGEAMRTILEQVGADPGLTPADRLVAAAVTILVGSYSRLADRVSVAKLVAVTGLSEGTIYRALRKLIGAGYLRREPAPNGVQLAALTYLEPLSPVTPVPLSPATGVEPGTPVTPNTRPLSGLTPVPLPPPTPSEKDRGIREENPSKEGGDTGTETAAISDALADALGHRPATRDERARWMDAVGQLCQAGATPDDVPRRVRAFRRRWPDREPTPAAIARWWGSLAARSPASPPPPVASEPEDAPASREEAAAAVAAFRAATTGPRTEEGAS